MPSQTPALSKGEQWGGFAFLVIVSLVILLFIKIELKQFY